MAHAPRRPSRRPVTGAARANLPRRGSDTSERWARLSWLVFGLLAAVVVARLMLMESLRSGLIVSPGSPAVPAGPGPASGLVLDLLACLPALVVLLRRWRDETYRLRLSWSMAPMGALAVWAVASTLWSADRFAAAVSSAHLFAAVVVLWTAAQLVRSWLALRLVAGLCAGTLLVLLAHGAYYLTVERPAMAQNWAQNAAEFLAQRNLQPGTFAAEQFEHRVLGGEVMGFSTSPNTYAALIVLTLLVSIGVGIDRVRAARGGVPRRLIAACAAAAALLVGGPAIWMLRHADSRTANATLALGVLSLAGLALAGGWLARHARLAYWAGFAAFLAASAALIGHGLRHGTLFQRSLTFRWHYWVGAARLIARHPVRGVGWDNFGLAYLGVRLPIAPEEVKDPHNFIVRVFAELGIIGGALLLAWMLRLWWELTRPAVNLKEEAIESPATAGGGTELCRNGVLAVVLAASAGVAFSVVAAVDFSQGASYAIVEVFQRLMFLAALLAGVAAVSLRLRPSGSGGAGEIELDDRPLPWTLAAMLVGLGLFLVHNLVDFALFEVGPMFLFALLTGAALGARVPPSAAPSPRRRRAAAVAMLAGSACWFLAAFALVVPVVTAEYSAAEGDELIRRARPAPAEAADSTGNAVARSQLMAGAAALQGAFERLPLNADYAARAGRAWAMAGDVARARRMYDAAVAARPGSPEDLAARAELELAVPVGGELPRVAADYAEAVRLDPANVARRLRHAELLETRLGRPGAARAEYESALWFDDQLPRDEGKRLPAGRVEEVRKHLAALGSGPNADRAAPAPPIAH